jgi:hypothetical protein
MSLTKRQAIANFRELVMPEIIRRYGRGDVIAQREEWNNYVDALQKDGAVTRYQADTWSNPF